MKKLVITSYTVHKVVNSLKTFCVSRLLVD